MKTILLSLILSASMLMVAAQSRLISGKVTSDDGKPVPFVSIMIKGTSMGVQADVNGEFYIRIRSSADTLKITGIDFFEREIIVGNQSALLIVLERKNNTIKEVIVTSAFSTRRSVRTQSSSYSVLEGKAAGTEISNKIGFKTWKRSGIDENSVRLAVGDKDYLPLKSVQVAVQIDGFRARILFDYFFFSDRDKQLRGDFRLKLPAGASPCYFAFGGTEYFNKDKGIQPIPFVDYSAMFPLNLAKDTIRAQRRNKFSNIKEAVVAPREKAAYAFNEVVRGNVDPALLEWAGADVFSCSVYPIQKNKLHRIVIGYDINLQEMGADAILKLFLPYSNIEKKLDIDIAVTDGLLQEIEPRIENRKNIAGKTKYHLANFTEQDFTVSIRTPAPVFLQDPGNEKYFAVNYEPDIPTAAATVASDAIFMLDVSLSSKPDKFNVWLRTIDGILKNNRKEIKRFAVLIFNVDATWWRDYYSLNNDYNVDSFLNHAANLSLLGATDLGNALKEAAHPGWLRAADTKPKTLFLLSDGDASWGEDNLFQLSGMIPALDKIFTFTTGFSGTDTRILNHLSRQRNGAVFSVLNEDEVEKAGVAIQSLPWHIKNISMNGASDILIAGRPYTVFAGQKLLITGRGKVDKDAMIRLTLEQGSIEKTYIIPASRIIGSVLTKRIYGQVAVNQLEDFSFKTEDESVKYSTFFEIPGKSCALLMLETGAMYKRYGLDSISTKSFIDSNLVNTIVQKVLETEKSEQSLGSAKADMNAWLKKIRKQSIIQLKTDSLFDDNIRAMPENSFIVDVPLLRTGIYFAKEWYPETLKELDQSILDYDRLMHMINLEKRAEGKVNAFKLISSFAELNRNDFTLQREVAYTLTNWNLDSKAYELLKRVLYARPAEPPTYLLLANSLVKMNRVELAMLYYDIAFLTDWDDRFEGFNLIAAIQYSRLLKDIQKGIYKTTNPFFVQKRLDDIIGYLKDNQINSEEADLMIMITWNTDNSDVDLHLREPSGEECYYQHKKTASGGFLSNDATEGFGPEMYFLKKAPSGSYHLDVEYFRSSNVQTVSKSKVMIDAYKNWGRPNQEHFQKMVVLKSSEKKKSKKHAAEVDDEKRLNDILVITF